MFSLISLMSHSSLISSQGGGEWVIVRSLTEVKQLHDILLQLPSPAGSDTRPVLTAEFWSSPDDADLTGTVHGWLDAVLRHGNGQAVGHRAAPMLEFLLEDGTYRDYRSKHIGDTDATGVHAPGAAAASVSPAYREAAAAAAAVTIARERERALGKRRDTHRWLLQVAGLMGLCFGGPVSLRGIWRRRGALARAR